MSNLALIEPQSAPLAAGAVAGPPVSPHADGIYFGLDEDEYHADTALGSTDIKTLSYSPEEYWFGSSLNPDREIEKSTPSKIFGSAVHKMILEGLEKFEAAYGNCGKADGKTKQGIADRKAVTDLGKIPLKGDDYDMILAAGESIRSNPYLAIAFQGGASEVSIFWTDNDIRKKCRIDHLKVRTSVDLKSIRPQRPIPFDRSCIRAISDYRYEVQALHYMDGRRAMRDLIATGAVFGEHNEQWLDLVAAQIAAFTFVFYRADGIPQTWGTTISPGNAVLDFARRTIDQAEANYTLFMDRFGPDKPWLDPRPLTELDISHLPVWHGNQG